MLPSPTRSTLGRRTLLAASLGAAASAVVAQAPAAAAPTEAIGVITADPMSVSFLTAALAAQGWDARQIHARADQTITGTTAAKTVKAISDIRLKLGREPAVWLIDLNRSGSDAAKETKAVLSALGTKARMIVWCAGGWPTARPDSRQLADNTAIERVVSPWPNAVFAEWANYVACHDDRSWWSGSALTTSGQQQKAKFLVEVHIGPRRGKESLRWNPTKLTAYRAPTTVGATYVDVRSLRSWDPTRTELRDQLLGLDRAAVVTLPAGRYYISGFQQPWLGGIRLGQAGTRGQQHVRGFRGVGRATEIRLRERSSRHADVVSPGKTGGTNPLEVMRFQDIKNGEVTNLALYGSEQGHLYHGLAFGNCPGLRLDGLYVRGLNRGDSDRPPGETFAINIGGGANTWIMNTELDGRDEVTGRRVSTSMIGWNGPGSSLKDPSRHARGSHMENIWYHDARNGMATWWLWDYITTINFWSDRSGGPGLNHEESGTGATPVLHYNPSLVVRGHWESRHRSPLPGVDSGNQALHWTMWSHYADQKGVKFYFLRPDDASYVRGRSYLRHDRGPDLTSGAMAVNNGRGYAGGNRSVTPARVFKASATRVTELAPRQAGTKLPPQSTNTAYFFHR